MLDNSRDFFRCGAPILDRAWFVRQQQQRTKVQLETMEEQC